MLLQLPIGLEDKFEGVVDLIKMKSLIRSTATTARTSSEGAIPADMVELAAQAREEMLDALSMFSDELTEAMLEDEGHRGAHPQRAIRQCDDRAQDARPS